MKIKDINPNLLRPDSGGNIAKPFIMSFWILVGIGILGLPATTIRCMAFKDTKAMHNAMINWYISCWSFSFRYAFGWSNGKSCYS